MLDSQGYLKLVDFGLAKDLMDGSKTFTVVGTVSWFARCWLVLLGVFQGETTV